MKPKEALAHADGMFKGVKLIANQELENIETSIAAAKALIESLEKKKAASSRMDRTF